MRDIFREGFPQVCVWTLLEIQAGVLIGVGQGTRLHHCSFALHFKNPADTVTRRTSGVQISWVVLDMVSMVLGSLSYEGGWKGG